MLQAVSSNFVLSKSHLKKIVSLSFESKKNNILLSNKFEIDLLMRFALSFEISHAINQVGIKPKSNFVLIGIGTKLSLNSLYDDLYPMTVPLFLKNHDSYLKRHFKITKKHLDSIQSKTPLEDILVEKAAILF